MIINTAGDPTGFAESFRLLYQQMPKARFVGAGDLVDRGPDSKGVLDFFIDNDLETVMGNHDHMMLFEAIKNDPDVKRKLYPDDCWLWNGGDETLKSFNIPNLAHLDVNALKKYFDFIRKMPLSFEEGGLMITHAPISDRKNKKVFDLKEINNNEYLLDVSALWNRSGPKKVPGKFQVYGHNSPRGILWHTDKHPQGIYMADPMEIPDGAWAVCIDTWRETYLTGLSIDTDLLDDPKKAITIFQQDLVEDSPFISKNKQNVRAAQKEYLAKLALPGVVIGEEE